MLEEFLDILLAVREGCDGIEAVAIHTGLAEHEARRHVQILSDSGFLLCGGQRLHVTPSGRALLSAGFDEVFKRALRENLGGEIDSAS